MNILDIWCWAFSLVTLANGLMSYWICGTLKELLEITLKERSAMRTESNGTDAA